ncbi:MAG: lmo0937 family membrane protein [Bacteroidota bacterium]
MNILYVIAVVLVILWVLGLLTSTFGNLIHILLAIAIVAVLLRVIRGRSALGTKS